MNKDFLTVPVTTEHTIYTHVQGVPKQIFLILHGYLLDGSYMLRKLKDTLPTDSLLIAPNGPFVVPVKKRERFEAKYAWYFFDPHTQNFYINFEPAANYLKQILASYNPDGLPVTVIGYSQGGYLSPKVAERVSQVNKVIGLACVFRNTRFEYRDDVLYHQINSKADLVVDFEGAKSEFEKLEALGNQGLFIPLEEVGHKIDKEYLVPLGNLL